MSWIRDEIGSLINLDKVEKIEVSPVEQIDETTVSHCLIAYFSPGTGELTTWLTSGSEEHCIERLHAIASKLHLLKT